MMSYKRRYVDIEKNTKLLPLSKNVIDIANYEICKGIFSSYVYYLKKISFGKKYSRNKKKMIRDGSYIPIEDVKVDAFGYIIPSVKLIYKTVVNMSYTINIKNIKYIMDENPIERIYPMHIQSVKYRTPCGANLDMFKYYLQHIKGLSQEMKNDVVNVTWMKQTELYKKILPVSLKSYKNVTRHYNYKKEYYNCLGIVKRIIKTVFRDNYVEFTNDNIHIPNIHKSFQNKHSLLPYIEVKCPCEFMGCKKCNKNINLLQIISIYYLINSNQIKEKKDSTHLTKFLKWVSGTFIKDLLIDDVNSNGVINVSIQRSVKMKKNPSKKVTKITNLTINRCVCHNCGNETITQSYKKSKTQIKKYGCQIMTSCKKCNAKMCKCCGNDVIAHSKVVTKRHKKITTFLNKCPSSPNFETMSDETIGQIQSALGEEDVETAKCPNCQLLVTKDDACDKVMCGKIDGCGISGGCGTKFCFRCSEDIGHMGSNYIDHLIVTMKPDGSNTNWICKRFAKACPSCHVKQFWDGTSDKITCGGCQTCFDVEV
jgi:hypothetical protein